MRQKIIAAALSCFIFGVFVSSFVDFGWAPAALFIFIGAVFLLFFGLNRAKFFLAAGLLFVSCGLGQLRYAAGNDVAKAGLGGKIEQKISSTGVIADEPEEKENYRRFIFETEEGKEKILVYAQKYPRFNYGDKLEIVGFLKKPQDYRAKEINFENPGRGRPPESARVGLEDFQNLIPEAPDNFSWPDYLAKDGIYYEMFYPQIEFVSSGNGFWLKEKLFALKEKFLAAISEAVPEPHAAFLGGITVGARESLPQNLQEKFRQTGVAHIVALSGYNITIVAETIMLFFSFLPQYLAIGGGAAGIALFAVMTGASATVLRASIMALLALAAKATGRIYAISWALFLAGFFMVLQNPKILRFDASFQLSFLATLGLIYLSPFFDKKLKIVPRKFKLREVFAATVSAQIAVLPLLIYKTGMFSVVSLPVNFLILPFIPMTMFFGFATGISGMFSGLMAAPFGWASYTLLQYELFIVDIFSKLPFSSVNIPGI